MTSAEQERFFLLNDNGDALKDGNGVPIAFHSAPDADRVLSAFAKAEAGDWLPPIRVQEISGTGTASGLRSDAPSDSHDDIPKTANVANDLYQLDSLVWDGLQNLNTQIDGWNHLYHRQIVALADLGYDVSRYTLEHFPKPGKAFSESSDA